MRSSFSVSTASSKAWRNEIEPMNIVEAIRIYFTILAGVTAFMVAYHAWLSPALLR